MPRKPKAPKKPPKTGTKVAFGLAAALGVTLAAALFESQQPFDEPVPTSLWEARARRGDILP